MSSNVAIEDSLWILYGKNPHWLYIPYRSRWFRGVVSGCQLPIGMTLPTVCGSNCWWFGYGLSEQIWGSPKSNGSLVFPIETTILIIYFDFEVSHGITLFVSFLDKHGQIDRQRDREICGLFSWVCMFFMAIVGTRSGVSRKSRCAKSKKSAHLPYEFVHGLCFLPETSMQWNLGWQCTSLLEVIPRCSYWNGFVGGTHPTMTAIFWSVNWCIWFILELPSGNLTVFYWKWP